MARPKNEKLKSELLAAARALFAEVGYKATSYSLIAQRCGVTRELVQYHFPKKELLAIGVMEQELVEAQERLGLTDDDLRGDFDAITSVGTQFFSQLLGPQGARQFLLDVIASRELTESVLAFNMAWCLARVDVPEAFDQKAVERAVIVRMGGFYELLYHCLKNDQELDVASELADVVSSFAQALR